MPNKQAITERLNTNGLMPSKSEIEFEKEAGHEMQEPPSETDQLSELGFFEKDQRDGSSNKKRGADDTAININADVDVDSTTSWQWQEEDTREPVPDVPRVTTSKKRKFKSVFLLGVSFCILVCLVISLTVLKKRFGVFCGIEAWKWFMLSLLLPLSILMVDVVFLLVELNFLVRKKLIYYVDGLRTNIEVLVTLIALLLTWSLWLTQSEPEPLNVKKSFEFVHQTLITLLVGSVLWFIKRFLLLELASSFYFNSFFDRIIEYMIQNLSGPPIIEECQEALGHYDYGVVQSSHIDVVRLLHTKPDQVSAYTKKQLVDLVAIMPLSTFPKLEGELEGEFEGVSKSIRSEKEAVIVAHLIFRNVARPGTRFMDVVDLRRFLIKTELDVVLPMLEVGKNGKVTLQAFSRWMVRAYKFRVVLQNAVADNKKAFNHLNRVLDGLTICVLIIVWLVLVKIATGNIVIVIFTQVAAAAFVFGDSIKKVFEASIFIFVVHPFDAGDSCVINGNPVMIEKMSVLTTTVSKFDNGKTYYPNSVLSTLPISNYSRSPHMGDSLEFSIDLMAPMEKIKQLHQEIDRYFKDNTHLWKPTHSLVMKEIDGMEKIKMVLNFTHTIGFREYTVRNERKSMLILELKKIFEELQLKTDVRLS